MQSTAKFSGPSRAGVGVLQPEMQVVDRVDWPTQAVAWGAEMTQKHLTAGAALFAKLKGLGVSYVFANSGTDFPPIIEGLIAAREAGVALPEAVTVPHEHVAVGMAHGYTALTGRAQAVMLHTNVGLSNAATGVINAASDQIPMIVMSGRTPVMEGGRFGARTVPIGWGQEMYDQAALIREACKWEYELRFPEQVGPALDRAWAIANSTPRGPVYLSLPREVLCEPCPDDTLEGPSSIAPAIAAPAPDAVQAAASLLTGAERPMIIAQRGPDSVETFAALDRFTRDRAIPVSHYWTHELAIPMSSPCHIPWSPDRLLKGADVVLVLSALAPWWPDRIAPPDDAKIIHLGPDPLFARTTPMRTFHADVTLVGAMDIALASLIAATEAQPKDEERIGVRRRRIAEISSGNRSSATKDAEAGCKSPMTKDWVSLCLGRALQDRRATVTHELGCPLPPLMLDDHKSYLQEPHSGGLGWGLPAAMGIQFADPDRLVVATMGDGSYMFANPTVCHQVCEALGLPVITLVLNNEEWGAVRHSVEGLYKGGLASCSNDVPLTALRPSPDFTLTAAASRAYTETVTDGAALPQALDRAIEVATKERRAVLLNIAIARETS